MKRLYIALSLIFVSLFICISASAVTQKEVSALQTKLSQIGEVISDGQEKKAEELLSSVKKDKDRAEVFLSMITDADKIEELNVSFEMINSHLKDKNLEHALERLRECVLLLEEIAANEKLSIKNVF